MPRKQRLKKKKQIEELKDQHQRVPRLMGLTLRAIQINQEPEETKKKRLITELQQYIIDQFVSSGMQLNSKVMDINELANYLGLKPEITLLRLNRTIERIGNMMKGDDGANIARALYFSLIKKGLAIEAQAGNQAAMLLAQQDQKYVPFLTGEANRALKNWMDSQKPLLDALRLFSDTTKTNLMLPANSPEVPSNGKFIGTDEALRLLQDNNQTMLQNPQLLEDKMIELEASGQTMEVRAAYQDLTSIGIKSSQQYLDEDGAYKAKIIPNEVLNDDDFKG